MSPARIARSALRGLTLIEIMVALAILAILASLAVPEFGRRMTQWKLQAVAERLAFDIADARHDAAQRGRLLHMDIQPGAQWCWALSDAPGCGCGTAQACQRTRVVAPAGSSVQIKEPMQLTFAPSADARSQPLMLTVQSHHDDQLRVVVTPMGRARICGPDRPLLGYPRC
ncbi:MAG: prepilin-type N-terminal cleavage/methylation domain-containing protein [Rubrivivax sp.]|nr:prepilin-type N-terminal cleavage/methylation domain-containing protein [Rubrivivax sp.]